MKINSIFMATAITAATMFAGCSSPSEKVEEADTKVIDAKESLEQAEEDYAYEVEAFRKETESKITANEQRIADLKDGMSKNKKEVKAEYKEQIAALEQKNSDMKKRMNEYKEDGRENWQSFKSEFNHDMEELGNAFKDITVNNEK